MRYIREIATLPDPNGEDAWFHARDYPIRNSTIQILYPEFLSRKRGQGGAAHKWRIREDAWEFATERVEELPDHPGIRNVRGGGYECVRCGDELTREEAEIVLSHPYPSGDSHIRDDSIITRKVTEDMCERIRELSPDHTYSEIAELLDQDISRHAVSEHALGHCYHGDSTGETASPRRVISASDCADMRRHKAAGGVLTEYAEDSEFSYSKIREHAAGRCEHDDDVVGIGPVRDPEHHPKVSPEQCSEMRWLSTHGASLTEIADRYNVAVGTAHNHVREKCAHETSPARPSSTNALAGERASMTPAKSASGGCD